MHTISRLTYSVIKAILLITERDVGSSGETHIAMLVWDILHDIPKDELLQFITSGPILLRGYNLCVKIWIGVPEEAINTECSKGSERASFKVFDDYLFKIQTYWEKIFFGAIF